MDFHTEVLWTDRRMIKCTDLAKNAGKRSQNPPDLKPCRNREKVVAESRLDSQWDSGISIDKILISQSRFSHRVEVVETRCGRQNIRDNIGHEALETPEL